MKKHNRLSSLVIVSLFLATMLCLSGTFALADSVYTNSAADCFEFFASKITFEQNRVVVEGYFYNFSLDLVVHSIENLEMEIYDADGEVICYGAFDNLSDSMQALRLEPGLSSLQVFEFNNTPRNPGDYNLDFFSAGILCSFASSGY